MGLYDGRVGVAYAAVRVSRLVGDRSLQDAARAVLSDVVRSALDRPLLDVISGAAGAAPALLVLAEWLSESRLVSAACELGDSLLRSATRGAAGWSWRDSEPDAGIRPNLTGLAHGAAGIGWSLLELHHATGEPRFRDGAMEAFRYEESWYRREEENWPDFRELDGDPAEAHGSVAWCHGAPGIGLTRLRALQLEGTGTFRGDVEAAARTTVRYLAERRHEPGFDCSPCHGQAGCVEFLLRASTTLGDLRTRDVAFQAAADAAERYAATPEQWPCGVDRGENPSLMLGLAGIGYSYLLLADPALDSLLLVAPHGSRASS